MKEITDTGHHLLRVGHCDCGWEWDPHSGVGPMAQSLEHHREVCEALVAENGFWRRLWTWPVRMVDKRRK